MGKGVWVLLFGLCSAVFCAPSLATEPLPCSSQLAFTFQDLTASRVWDGYGKRIHGTFEVRDNTLWFFVEFNEPLWIADKDPYTLAPGVERTANGIVLHNVKVVEWKSHGIL